MFFPEFDTLSLAPELIRDYMLFGLSEEKVWTTLKNNLSPQTSITSADQEGKAVLQITYNVTDEQVHAAHCVWYKQIDNIE